MKSFSHVRLFATPWTVACQAPLSMGFSRQKYWSGLPFLSPGDLPHPGIEPGSPSLEAAALISEPPEKPTFRLILLELRSVCSCSVVSHVRLFVTPWTAARQASLSSTISWSLLKFMSIESVISLDVIYSWMFSLTARLVCTLITAL